MQEQLTSPTSIFDYGEEVRINTNKNITGGQQPSKINYEISKSLRFQVRFPDFMFQDCNKISR